MSIFCLDSLKAAFLCKNSSVKRGVFRGVVQVLGNIISVFLSSHLKLSSVKELEDETEVSLASGFRVEGAALQHLLDTQTLKLCV